MNYYHKLFSLFLKAKGIKRNELKQNRNLLTKEFYNWIPIYMEQSSEYRNYLINYMGLDLNDPYLMELDKGYIDSVIDKNAIMVSNYAFTKGNENSMLVFDGRDNIMMMKNKGIYSIDNIEMIMTHNPYSLEEIKRVEKTINNFNKKIILGVYGNINDYDRKTKINHLKKVRDSIPNIEYDYNEREDNYFYVLTKK